MGTETGGMLRACPRCNRLLAPVALCEDVWGCASCKETWHLPKGCRHCGSVERGHVHSGPVEVEARGRHVRTGGHQRALCGAAASLADVAPEQVAEWYRRIGAGDDVAREYVHDGCCQRCVLVFSLAADMVARLEVVS